MSDTTEPGAQRTASLVGAPSGRATDELTLEVLDGAGGDFRVADGAGLLELPDGTGTSTYELTYAAPTVAGLYVERWRDTVPDPDVVVDNELEVLWSYPAAGAVAVPTYAAPPDLRTRLEVDAAALTDAAATRLITRAEFRLDRVAGAWPIRPNGRKLDPTTLPSLFSDAIREATLDLAEAEYRNPDAFTLNAVDGQTGLIKGPDFELRSPTPLPPAGRAALRDAAARLDALNLRALSARPRP